MAEVGTPKTRRDAELIFGGSALVVAGLLVAVLIGFFGAHLDAPTLALAATCAALMYALRGLFRVVQALARPDVEMAMAPGSSEGRAAAELRDEKRRVLRGIKELDFDFGMGKLSKADYEHIRGAYEIRAIEVMRELEDEGPLHPELEAALARMAGEPAAEAVEAVPEAASATAPTCGACEGANDRDAKFCKHCGAQLEGGS